MLCKEEGEHIIAINIHGKNSIEHSLQKNRNRPAWAIPAYKSVCRGR
jgi:hypothetical protein